MGMFSQSKQILIDEKNKQAAAKKARKEKAASEKFSTRALRFLKVWTLRLFYTAFVFVVAYSAILAGTLAIPNMMAIVIASMGFALDSTVEIVLASLSGLFFTGWIFAISFYLVKKVFKIYLNKMKSTLSEEAIARFNELKSK